MNDDARSRDDDADVNDRHVMREALWSVERAAERFRAIIPDVGITHGDARDLIEDADELAHQLYVLTRAQRTNDQMTDAELAARASAYLGVNVEVETVNALDLAARAPAFPSDDNDPTR